MKKIILTGMAVAAALCVAVYAVSLAMFFFMMHEPDRPFDAAAWAEQAGNGSLENPRGHMVDDLVENRLPMGMPEQDVRLLLGKPDFESGDRLSYNVGGMSGFGMDMDTLDVTFDENRTLVRAVTVQH